MKSKAPKLVCYYFLRAVAYILCIWLFINLMKDIWIKFSSKVTTTGIRFRFSNAEARPLPCFTIHEFSAFKTKGFYYTDEMIKDNSFRREEIFGDLSLSMFWNTLAKITVRELFSIYFGTCFTVCIDVSLPSR